MIDSVKKLEAYSKAKQLVKDTYALLKLFPREEQYALCDQLRRAVISVPSNIAEGMGRFGSKEQAHFLDIAYGSLLEAQCQMEIAYELGYISAERYTNIDQNMNRLGAMLVHLRALRRPLNPSPHQPLNPSTPQPFKS